MSGLSFCVLDELSKTIYAYENHSFGEKVTPKALLRNTEALFTEKEILQQPFKKVHVIHRNNLSAWVPRPLFDEKKLSEYLKFNIRIFETDFVTYDDPDISGLINVYVPLVNINNFIFDRFGEFEYRHYSSILVETLIRHSPENGEPLMYVHKQDTHFEIVILKNRRLLLYNSFEYGNEIDFIYYILFTAEQSGLDPETFPLYLLGDITPEDTFFNMAHTYVRKVSCGQHHCPYKLDDGILPVKSHESPVLLNSF
ncbi:DUF3822 family protein [Sinomicrobium soli]|uniref:DUF3822 family protein n=1 Tax=Sinomicrobium sp. N-1-3-6 TaxID=2219864 RepID=UPI001F17AE69|nr:DUF3822 family protein [Sinomicrobium sp. N-1-3-6]